MTNRIENTFAQLKTENRAAMIPFIMGFDPDLKTSAAILDALPKAGADLIEIGIPFSDPMADGPVIQAAGLRALKSGAKLTGILELVKNCRKTHADVPIILMGYFNPIYAYGAEKFCKDASAAGIDGLILVDLPPEEEQEMKPYLHETGLKLIRLIAPTSDEGRLPLLCKSASGFVYYISVAGITGAKSADSGQLKKQIGHLREFTKLPVAVGFGIKTAAQVKEVAAYADAVVVGSALVGIIEKAMGDKVKAAADFVSELAKGVRR